MCCCTSAVRWMGGAPFPAWWIRSALYSSGRCCGSNSTSSTGPMTCTTWPTVGAPADCFAFSCFFVAMWTPVFWPLALQGFRSTHDFRQLLRDLRLARAIVRATQHVQNLSCIVGGVLHRRALRAEERRSCFNE